MSIDRRILYVIEIYGICILYCLVGHNLQQHFYISLLQTHVFNLKLINLFFILSIFLPRYLGITYHNYFTVMLPTVPMFSPLSVPSAFT